MVAPTKTAHLFEIKQSVSSDVQIAHVHRKCSPEHFLLVFGFSWNDRNSPNATTTSSECVVAGGVHYGSEANHKQEETEIIMHMILYLVWSLSLDFTAFSITMHNIIFLLEVRFYQSIALSV